MTCHKDNEQRFVILGQLYSSGYASVKPLHHHKIFSFACKLISYSTKDI